ncbi:MAG: hypothetical protein LUQ07_02040, partial [Methanospirillum sp.]|nr:hypothetical protein [Methanospirillum sp.]
VNLIVTNTSIPYMEEMGITVLPGTNVTDPVFLISEGSPYVVKTGDGRRVAINAQYVIGNRVAIQK